MNRLRRWQRRLRRDALAIEAAYAALQAGSDDPEALHTLRVAVRGLRASLAPFAARPDIAIIRAELGALAHDTNVLRDDEVVLALLATLPGSGALLATLTPAAEQTTLVTVLTLHGTAIDTLHLRVLQAVDALDQTRLEAGSRLATRRARRKMHRTLEQLTPATPASQWHAARLLVKKARYLHDGQALWLDKRWQRFGPQCKPAQEALGHLHDLDVLHQRYGGQFDPALAEAWQAARHHGLANADAAVWALARVLKG
ncbi:CHAD domain-containing protein [Jeongeupia chitinilytica]|uniref:CHAD domain-containing protein n=1 Tax=Jeongeupia chitinilytica TaxID=1041641 RepID=A0ABQ3H2U1_9NEIS|nr:CHAD domain-containing protein [Jeongeupia chitinilytica]GHD63569.1 hypothetical protein GCM10007350_21210 [Jeongeupia chitinilytica]